MRWKQQKQRTHYELTQNEEKLKIVTKMKSQNRVIILRSIHNNSNPQNDCGILKHLHHQSLWKQNICANTLNQRK